MTEVRCSICGHRGNSHRYAYPDPICGACPEAKCQDGPAGRAFRESLGVSLAEARREVVVQGRRPR